MFFSKQDKAPSSEEDVGRDASICEAAAVVDCTGNETVSDTEQESSSKNIFSHDSDAGTDNMEKEEQTQHTCEEMEPKAHQSSENTDSCNQSEEHDSPAAEFSSESAQDLQLVSGGVGIDQFLRQRDEPETVNSDASEQGSVRLEPLTPSEVLEYEATEILHKGDGSSASINDTMSDQTGSSPGGSRAETAVDLEDGKKEAEAM